MYNSGGTRTITVGFIKFTNEFPLTVLYVNARTATEFICGFSNADLILNASKISCV